MRKLNKTRTWMALSVLAAMVGSGCFPASPAHADNSGKGGNGKGGNGGISIIVKDPIIIKDPPKKHDNGQGH